MGIPRSSLFNKNRFLYALALAKTFHYTYLALVVPSFGAAEFNTFSPPITAQWVFPLIADEDFLRSEVVY